MDVERWSDGKMEIYGGDNADHVAWSGYVTDIYEVKEALNRLLKRRKRTMSKEFEKFVMEREREQSNRKRWIEFEHTLQYLLCELKDKIDKEDNFLLSDIKQAVIVYGMKDKFEETNGVFLNNIKNDFYNAIQKLEEKHTDIQLRTFTIKLFMEDFYFGKQS